MGIRGERMRTNAKPDNRVYKREDNKEVGKIFIESFKTLLIGILAFNYQIATKVAQVQLDLIKFIRE